MAKKWIFLTGLLVCLVAAAWLYHSYQQPRAGVAKVAADYQLPAEKLYQDFATNEAASNEKYNGKILTVTGTVAEVQNDNEALLILLSGAGGGSVSCSFAAPFPGQLPALQTTATIKGRCTGFLMDVNLVDAVLVQ